MNHGITVTGLFSAIAGESNNKDAFNISHLSFTPYRVEGRKGVSVFPLYDTRNECEDGSSAALVRYASNAKTPRHMHPGWELVLVIEGELIDDRGRHGPGVLQVYPPKSTHELSSETGCTFLVIWEKPVKPVQTTV